MSSLNNKSAASAVSHAVTTVIHKHHIDDDSIITYATSMLEDAGLQRQLDKQNAYKTVHDTMRYLVENEMVGDVTESDIDSICGELTALLVPSSSSSNQSASTSESAPQKPALDRHDTAAQQSTGSSSSVLLKRPVVISEIMKPDEHIVSAATASRTASTATPWSAAKATTPSSTTRHERKQQESSSSSSSSSPRAAAADKQSDDDDEKETAEGEESDEDLERCCALCKRETFVTAHHLFPRKLHKRLLKSKSKKYTHNRLTKEQLHQTIMVCRPCHSMLHRVFTHQQMADEYHTVEKLLGNEDVQKFINYVSKQRTSVQNPQKMGLRYAK